MKVTGSETIQTSSATRQTSALLAGFTIVETIIVLAIAGLVLLIVLEAIPALTRNGENNRRKQDITAILQAISHYELNNSANFPAPASPYLQYTTLTYYIPANITLHGQTPPAQATVPPVTNNQKVEIYNYEKCDATNPGTASTQGTDYTNVVALYAIDSGNGNSAGQCQQL